ncbi:MAG: DUF3313 domain-containing protein [Zetaproteobacteria bacterium]|nr:DUF3313 domain-containing protein [Zetaproteobacteria bacterium]
MNKYLGNLALLGCILVFSGCGTHTTTASVSDKAQTGFIPDYSVLQPVKSAEGTQLFRYQKPGVRRGNYSAIIIEPILINQTQADEKITPEVIQQTQQELDKVVREHIAKTGFKIVSDAGPGVARVAIAISGAEVDNEGLKPRNLIPISAAITAVSYLIDKQSKMPVLLVECKITDSQSNDLLRAGVMTIKGDTFRNESDTTTAFLHLAQQAVTAAVTASTK